MDKQTFYRNLILNYLLEGAVGELTHIAADPAAQTALADLQELLSWQDEVTWLEELAAWSEGLPTPLVANLMAHPEIIRQRLPALVAHLEAMQALPQPESLDLLPQFPSFAEQFQPKREEKRRGVLIWGSWGRVVMGMAALGLLFLCLTCSPVTTWLIWPRGRVETPVAVLNTPTPLPRLTATLTPTSIPQPVVWLTPSPTAQPTVTPQLTPLPQPSAAASPTPLPTQPKPSPTAINTPSPTATSTTLPTVTPNPTLMPTATPMSATHTPPPIATPRPATATPQPATPTVENTPTVESTPTPQAQATPTVEATSTPQATPTLQATPTIEVTPTPQATPTIEVTPTPQATPTIMATPTPQATSTPQATPTIAMTPTPQATPTFFATVTPMMTLTPVPVTATPTPAKITILNSITSGSVQALPLTSTYQILTDTIRVGYFSDGLGTCYIERGVLEFDIPAQATPVTQATLILTELTHEPITQTAGLSLNSYPADLLIEASDFDRPATLAALWGSPPTPPLDLTPLFADPAAQRLGFRLQMQNEPPCQTATHFEITFQAQLLLQTP